MATKKENIEVNETTEVTTDETTNETVKDYGRVELFIPKLSVEVRVVWIRISIPS